jgi:hypothetical protein
MIANLLAAKIFLAGGENNEVGPCSRGKTQKSAPTVPGNQGLKQKKFLAEPLVILSFAWVGRVDSRMS